MATVMAPVGPMDGRGLMAQRAADAMLRSLGATQITLRVAQPPVGGTNNELGMASSGFEDVPLGPAAVRSTAMAANETVQVEALVSASAAIAAATAHGTDDVATWLLEAHGLLYGNRLLHIDAVTVDHFAGLEYLYHIRASE